MNDDPKALRSKALQKAKQQRRLSAALRENLRRRKAQAKERAGGETAAEGAEKAHDSAGIIADKRAGRTGPVSR